jgi:hypothetical protein
VHHALDANSRTATIRTWKLSCPQWRVSESRKSETAKGASEMNEHERMIAHLRETLAELCRAVLTGNADARKIAEVAIRTWKLLPTGRNK